MKKKPMQLNIMILTLIRAAGGVYEFRNFERYISAKAQVVTFKIRVFLEKRLVSKSS